MQGKAIQRGGVRRRDALLVSFVYRKRVKGCEEREWKEKDGVRSAQASSLAFLVIQPKSDCGLVISKSHANFKLVPTPNPKDMHVSVNLSRVNNIIIFVFFKDRVKGPETGYNCIWILYWNAWTEDASCIPRMDLPRISDLLIK